MVERLKPLLTATLLLFPAACGSSESLKDLAKDGAKLGERLANFVEKGEEYGFPPEEYIEMLKVVEGEVYGVVLQHEAGVVKRLGRELKKPLYAWILKENGPALARAIRTLNTAAECGKTDPDAEVTKKLIGALADPNHDVHSNAGQCLAFLYSHKWDEPAVLFRDPAVEKLDPAASGLVMLYSGLIRCGCVAVDPKRIRDMAGVVLSTPPHPVAEETKLQAEVANVICGVVKEIEGSAATDLSGLRALWEKNWKYVYIDRGSGGVAVFKINKAARTIGEEVEASTGIQLKDK